MRHGVLLRKKVPTVVRLLMLYFTLMQHNSDEADL
jgi:hypothetical protein